MSETHDQPPSEAVQEDGADAALRLLSRTPSDAYLETWASRLRHAEAEEVREQLSAVILRLGPETFALETQNVVEVRRVRAIRRMPGRSNDVFRGLVSIRGDLHLCASLHALLGIEAETDPADRRLLVIERDAERWACEVDEVGDCVRIDTVEVKDAQVTITKSAVHFTNGLVQYEGGVAARLDPERLFPGLARSIA